MDSIISAILLISALTLLIRAMVFVYSRSRKAAPASMSRAMEESGAPTADAWPGAYDIEYTDADGVVTTRTIDVISVSMSAGAVYIRAFCRLRAGERTFRADRILAASRAPAGEPIQGIERHFFLMAPEDARPDPDHDSVMARVRSGLDILIWIARSDREISSDEEEKLLEYVGERNGLAGRKFAEVPWSRTKAAGYIDGARPTFATSIGALAKMSRTGREHALLTKYAGRIAASGGAGAENRRAQLFGR